MAQRTEAMRAGLLDTSTQDALTAQYSLTVHRLVQERGRLEGEKDKNMF